MFFWLPIYSNEPINDIEHYKDGNLYLVNTVLIWLLSIRLIYAGSDYNFTYNHVQIKWIMAIIGGGYILVLLSNINWDNKTMLHYSVELV